MRDKQVRDEYSGDGALDLKTELPVRHSRFVDLLDLIPLADPDREQIPVHAPFTGARITTIPSCTRADVELAFSRARVAQELWAQRRVSERKKIIVRYHDLVFDRRDELLDLMQIESGKARLHALEEVLDVVITARHFAHRAEQYLRPRRHRGVMPLLTKVIEYRHPVGVVGLIAPWNYPLTLAISDAIPALLAGNAVILKPAQQTSLTALRAAHLFYEAGLPRDVFQVVTGKGSTIGAELISRSDFIGFTGSTEIGRRVASQAGERLIPGSMELGGKNPMLVLNDAELDNAIEGAVRACFTNAGQLCISVERLYVQSDIYDRFKDAFIRRIRALRLGPDFDYTVDVGSLISREQLNKTQEHIQDAVDKGARVLVGGRTRPDLGPFFFEPTVLEKITPEMKVFAEETFGPVVCLYPFDRVEDAVRLANNSIYGLNASVWTTNTSYGIEIARRIQCGTVNVNDGYMATWGSVDAPMGGMKASGIGRRHGQEGFFKYTESQTIAAQRGVSLIPVRGQQIQRYANVASRLLKTQRYLPGLR